jgi:hypothetical protein
MQANSMTMDRVVVADRQVGRRRILAGCEVASYLYQDCHPCLDRNECGEVRLVESPAYKKTKSPNACAGDINADMNLHAGM